MERGFEFVRESSRDRLWLRTPITLTQNPFSYFVYQLLSKEPALCSWMYLNRWETEPVDAIACGQCGDFYTFAYLPHIHRRDLKESEWGLIHVPEKRLDILGRIEEELTGYSNFWNESLNGNKERHKRIISEMFKSSEELIGKNIHRLEGKFEGEFFNKLISKGYVPVCQRTIPETLPSCWYDSQSVLKEKWLEYQTSLDFMRDLFSAIKRGLPNAERELRQKYAHLISEGRTEEKNEKVA